ncbi:MAG TPA: hypothetical protein VEH27_12735 [Methylomirabilota bacterium]|nr:hypothetical protein [Methylomirabilota bacterium]
MSFSLKRSVVPAIILRFWKTALGVFILWTSLLISSGANVGAEAFHTERAANFDGFYLHTELTALSDPYEEPSAVQLDGETLYVHGPHSIAVLDRTTLETRATLPTADVRDILFEGTSAFVRTSEAVEIYDISKTAQPRRIASLAIDASKLKATTWPTTAIYLHKRGNFLYFNDAAGDFRVARIDAGGTIVLLDAKISGPGALIRSEFATDRYLLLHNFWQDLRLLDLSVPETPRVTHRWEGKVAAAAVSGDRLAVNIPLSDTANIVNPQGQNFLYQLTESGAPVQVGFFATPGYAWMKFFGNFLYEAYLVFDISDLAAPRALGRLPSTIFFQAFHSKTGYATVPTLPAGSQSLSHFNLVDPLKPGLLKSVVPFPSKPTRGIAWGVQGDHIYVQERDGMNRIYDYAKATQPKLLATLPANYAAPRLRNAFVYLPTQNGVSIYDVADPARPSRVGSISLRNVTALETQGEHLFLLTRDSGAQRQSAFHVYSLTNAANPTRSAYLPFPLGDHRPRVLTISKNRAYIATFGESGAGAHPGVSIAAMDISNPESPVPKGTFASDSTFAVMNVHVYQDYLFLGGNQLKVIDFRNADSPKAVGELPYPEVLGISGSELFTRTQNGSTLLNYDISVPDTPRRIQSLPVRTKPLWAHASQNRLHLTLTDIGVQVFERQPLSRLSDEFSDSNDDGWTHWSPLAAVGVGASFKVEAGVYKLAVANSPNPQALPTEVGSAQLRKNFSDVKVQADVWGWVSGSHDSTVALQARAQMHPHNLATYYALTLTPKPPTQAGGGVPLPGLEFSITKKTRNGVITLVSEKLTASEIRPDQTYTMSFEVIGSTLKGSLHQKAGPNRVLLAELSSTDAQFNEGYVGVISFKSGALTGEATNGLAFTIDNFHATGVEAPHRLHADEEVIYWSSGAADHVLEHSVTADGTFTTSAQAPSEGGFGFIKTVPVSQAFPSEFFRLKKAPALAP